MREILGGCAKSAVFLALRLRGGEDWGLVYDPPDSKPWLRGTGELLPGSRLLVYRRDPDGDILPPGESP
ncbi:MAG: hypothetical protein R3F11_08470 [Verrucomicrobiales bacterium]